MRVFVYILAGPKDLPDLFEPIVSDGHEVHFISTAMSAVEVYDECMAADSIILRHNDDAAESGTILGFGLAFGKMVYVLADVPPDNVFTDMEGVVLYNDLYDLLPDLRADLKEIKDGAARPEVGGDSGSVPGGGPESGTTG